MAAAGPIVVGVDDYPDSLTAVDLAMREGALHERPVHLVHADPWADHPAWRNQPASADDLLSPPEVTIRAALRRVGDGTTVPVTSEIIAGSPVRVLLHQARHASMLVVGERGSGGFASLMLGSVALQLATHSSCPVLVARGQTDPRDPVVVGVDISEANQPALGFAFAEAAARNADLIAVHTWVDLRVVRLADMILPDYNPDLIEKQETNRLTEALQPWQAAHPTVKVHQQVIRARASTTLVEASRRAQLVVVGARGSGGFPGLRLGSVTHALLHHSHCPVAVVHHNAPA